MSVAIAASAHPLLDAAAFVMRFAASLGATATPDAIRELGLAGAVAPVTPPPAAQRAVRDLLRHGGFKPSGRSKPASEYLVGAVAGGRLPSINAGVDACNVASLHAGLPISLVDLDRVDGALRIAIAPAGTSYAFNPSGQTIDVSGLVCLMDAQGPTGTPVKDAQRTKTHPGTQRALALVWGTTALPGHTAAITRWYRELAHALPGVTVEDVELLVSAP